MAKLYGGRWRVVSGDLGEGGQSVILRVVDDYGEYNGEFALKRIRNPWRHQRFQNEITAIKRLEHPNIIKLIDHSALDDVNSNNDKQFLVMPIAEGKDLGKPSRYKLYSGALDSVLLVSITIAKALQVAHLANVIHRDIKPENILFTGDGHDLWIADFGICLLREQPRNTPDGEVVGPQNYMAPELEAGGNLEVTPAADIYSLGKVIYFMISGGIVIPRERLHEKRYSAILSAGEKTRRTGILLSQMICLAEPSCS